MADVFTPEERSRIMSGIRSKNTKPEYIIRSALHRLGFRFKLHDKKLPGRPDLVFPKFKAVLFIHGCFWHGHEDCIFYRPPKSKQSYWNPKITRNKERDQNNKILLQKEGWRVGEVWECALKGKSQIPLNSVISRISGWLVGKEKTVSIRGLHRSQF